MILFFSKEMIFTRSHCKVWLYHCKVWLLHVHLGVNIPIFLCNWACIGDPDPDTDKIEFPTSKGSFLSLPVRPGIWKTQINKQTSSSQGLEISALSIAQETVPGWECRGEAQSWMQFLPQSYRDHLGQAIAAMGRGQRKVTAGSGRRWVLGRLVWATLLPPKGHFHPA